MSSEQKIKKSEESLTVRLIKNKDILADVASLPNPPYCVGFAAETEQVLDYARQKRLAKRIPMIVANHASTAMGSEQNSVTIIDAGGEHALGTDDKINIAFKLLTHLKSQFD
jgi:phosphopantothenoylcysteine decarboxylase / phosphopantothenate---cysteine ligase